jgi:catechol 2,3-dioxygenase-like lactoylglutathione lyase family enzyme
MGSAEMLLRDPDGRHVSVRSIVRDVEAAIGFYTRHLGFGVQIHPNEAFAMLNRGDLRLVLSVPPPTSRPGRRRGSPPPERCPHPGVVAGDPGAGTTLRSDKKGKPTAVAQAYGEDPDRGEGTDGR